jgi:hypothetical protein
MVAPVSEASPTNVPTLQRITGAVDPARASRTTTVNGNSL